VHISTYLSNQNETVLILKGYPFRICPKKNWKDHPKFTSLKTRERIKRTKIWNTQIQSWIQITLRMKISKRNLFQVYMLCVVNAILKERSALIVVVKKVEIIAPIVCQCWTTNVAIKVQKSQTK
jgi:hypothetical protein